MNLVEVYGQPDAEIHFDTDSDPEDWEEMLERMIPEFRHLNKNDHWHIEVPKAGWRATKMIGHFFAYSPLTFMEKVLPSRTSSNGTIRLYKDRIEMMVYYHDAPTGEVRIIRPDLDIDLDID